MLTRKNVLMAIKERNLSALENYVAISTAAQINSQDQNGNTLLHIATSEVLQNDQNDESGKAILCDIVGLLAGHVNQRIRNKLGQLAVHALLEKCLEDPSFIPLLDTLLTKEHINEECYVKQYHYLHQAVQHKNWELVRAMLRKGVDVNRLDDSGQTALTVLTSLACKRDEFPDDIVAGLCHPETVNGLRMNDRFTPLKHAIKNANSSLILQLIANGAAEHIPFNYVFEEYLHYACRIQADLSDKAFQALFHPNALNKMDDHSETPLHIAAWNRTSSHIKLLVQAGADIRARARARGHRFTDETAIDIYCGYGDSMSESKIEPEIVELLLHRDATKHGFNVIRVLMSWFRDEQHHSHNEDKLVSVLSSMLLYIKGDDYVGLDVQHNSPEIDFILSLNEDFVERLNLRELEVVNKLLRRGMVCRSSMRCSDAVSAHHPSLPEYMKEKASDLDSVWKKPFTLKEECCFTVRANIRYPPKHNIQQLALPDRITAMLLFHDAARDIFHTQQEKTLNYKLHN